MAGELEHASDTPYIRDVDTIDQPIFAKVFQSGNSQAVRIPKEFRLDADEVEITREGDALVLRPRERTMKRFLELLQSLPDEMFEGIKEERPPEERDGL